MIIQSCDKDQKEEFKNYFQTFITDVEKKVMIWLLSI